MTLWLVVKAIIVWLVILGLAFANAALREAVLVPWIGKVRGLTLSGVILSALVLAVAYLTLPWIGAVRVRVACHRHGVARIHLDIRLVDGCDPGRANPATTGRLPVQARQPVARCPAGYRECALACGETQGLDLSGWEGTPAAGLHDTRGFLARC